MIIFAINLDVKKEDKKIDQLKSPLINKNIPKNPIRLFQKNEIVELKNVYNELYAINFFASWCLPCKIEAPAIKLLSEKIPVFGVAFKDEEKNILDFLKTFGNPYDKIGIDRNGLLGIEWGVYGIPETFIINKNREAMSIIIKEKGQIIYKYTGPLEIDELEKNIYDLIKNER